MLFSHLREAVEEATGVGADGDYPCALRFRGLRADPNALWADILPPKSSYLSPTASGVDEEGYKPMEARFASSGGLLDGR
jgi:hypothetical protein